MSRRDLELKELKFYTCCEMYRESKQRSCTPFFRDSITEASMIHGLFAIVDDT